MIYGDTMKQLPESDRPYEKIESYGAEVLSDTELLAAVVRSGTKNLNAIDVSRRLLARFGGNLAAVCDAGIAELKEIEGIGTTKAVQIKAIGEIAKRVAQRINVPLITASSSEKIGEMLVIEMGARDVETFRVIFLDKKLRITGQREISKGILDRTIVHPREIYSDAVRERSNAIIIAHNHPSGVCEPSDEDLMLTRRVMRAGKIMGIPMLDHIIVGKNDYYSMNSAGDLKFLDTEDE